MVCSIWTRTEGPKAKQLFLKSQRLTEWQGLYFFLIFVLFSLMSVWSIFFFLFASSIKCQIHSVQNSLPTLSSLDSLLRSYFCTLGSWISASMLLLLPSLFYYLEPSVIEILYVNIWQRRFSNFRNIFSFEWNYVLKDAAVLAVLMKGLACWWLKIYFTTFSPNHLK